MICANCGKEISSWSICCSHCGEMTSRGREKNRKDSKSKPLFDYNEEAKK